MPYLLPVKVGAISGLRDCIHALQYLSEVSTCSKVVYYPALVQNTRLFAYVFAESAGTPSSSGLPAAYYEYSRF